MPQTLLQDVQNMRTRWSREETLTFFQRLTQWCKEKDDYPSCIDLWRLQELGDTKPAVTGFLPLPKATTKERKQLCSAVVAASASFSSPTTVCFRGILLHVFDLKGSSPSRGVKFESLASAWSIPKRCMSLKYRRFSGDESAHDFPFLCEGYEVNLYPEPCKHQVRNVGGKAVGKLVNGNVALNLLDSMNLAVKATSCCLSDDAKVKSCKGKTKSLPLVHFLKYGTTWYESKGWFAAPVVFIQEEKKEEEEEDFFLEPLALTTFTQFRKWESLAEAEGEKTKDLRAALQRWRKMAEEEETTKWRTRVHEVLDQPLPEDFHRKEFMKGVSTSIKFGDWAKILTQRIEDAEAKEQPCNQGLLLLEDVFNEVNLPTLWVKFYF